MRDENYYRDKQARTDARNTVGAIHKRYVIISNAMAWLKEIFRQPECKRIRSVHNSSVKLINHRRSLKQRLIRRYKHACKMRNAA